MYDLTNFVFKDSLLEGVADLLCITVATNPNNLSATTSDPAGNCVKLKRSTRIVGVGQCRPSSSPRGNGRPTFNEAFVIYMPESRTTTALSTDPATSLHSPAVRVWFHPGTRSAWGHGRSMDIKRWRNLAQKLLRFYYPSFGNKFTIPGVSGLVSPGYPIGLGSREATIPGVSGLVSPGYPFGLRSREVDGHKEVA
ncbi:hypothetical protein J6590_067519 [Homalodisca vitripennis]|nr:hypothetical protein J6590_067519 [Homalodisca vitripennis]